MSDILAATGMLPVLKDVLEVKDLLERHFLVCFLTLEKEEKKVKVTNSSFRTSSIIGKGEQLVKMVDISNGTYTPSGFFNVVLSYKTYTEILMATF